MDASYTWYVIRMPGGVGGGESPKLTDLIHRGTCKETWLFDAYIDFFEGKKSIIHSNQWREIFLIMTILVAKKRI